MALVTILSKKVSGLYKKVQSVQLLATGTSGAMLLIIRMVNFFIKCISNGGMLEIRYDRNIFYGFIVLQINSLALSINNDNEPDLNQPFFPCLVLLYICE